MKIHRFFYEFNFSDGLFFLRDHEIINQAKNVLKLSKGEYIVLINEMKKEAKAQIVNINEDFIQLRLIDICENQNQSEKEICLYASILKKDNFEWVVQKATEIGISEIIPTIYQRTIKTNLSYERLEKIVKEAGEQSERGDLMKVSEIVDFKKIFKDSKIKDDFNILFDRSGEKLNEWIGKNKDIKKKINIFIGPEGGFAFDEIFLAKKNGFEIVNLGNLMLRGETASIVSSFVIVNLLDS